jgi:hypothetical protein
MGRKVKAAGSSGGLRSRIVEFRRMTSAEVAKHAGNCRTHPQAQRDAVRGIVQQVGKCGVLMAWPSERNGGQLTVWDGHLRLEEWPDETWDVAVTDLTDAEADLMLASYDQMTALAEIDPVKLDALLREVETESQAVADMFADLTAELYREKAPEASGSSGGECIHEQAVQLRPNREYVVVYADSADDWERMREVLGLEFKRRGGYRIGSPFDAKGLERVVPAKRLFEAINAHRDSVNGSADQG